MQLDGHAVPQEDGWTVFEPDADLEGLAFEDGDLARGSGNAGRRFDGEHGGARLVGPADDAERGGSVALAQGVELLVAAEERVNDEFGGRLEAL